MHRRLLRMYFTANVILLTLMALVYPFIDPGTASAAIAKLNLLILVPSTVVSGALIYRKVREERGTVPLDPGDR